MLSLSSFSSNMRSSIFLFLLVDYLKAEFPCYKDWLYSPASGKCYLLSTKQKSRDNASAYCDSVLSSIFATMAGRVTLSEVRNAIEAEALYRVLSSVGNNDLQWTNAQWNLRENTFMYVNGDVVGFPNAIIDSSNSSGNCLNYRYFYHFGATGPSWSHNFTSADCSKPMSFVCEHSNSRCHHDDLPGFNSVTMRLSPEHPNIDQALNVDCRIGYYRPIGNTKGSTTATCNGTKHPSQNPSQVAIVWVRPSYYVEPCLRVSCSPPLPNISRYSINSTVTRLNQASYPFSFEVGVKCAHGYVNYLNRSQTIASIQCGQSTIDLSKGAWQPATFSPCVPVSCSMEEMRAAVPVEGILVQSRQKRSQQVLKPSQIDMYPLYDNIVTVACKEGTFFFDRKVEKFMLCSLKNQSMIEGDWNGYNGDKLPFPTGCIDVTCVYESILVLPEMNMQSSFYKMQTDGSLQAMNEHSGELYERGSRLYFLCKPGFRSALQNADQNVTCGNRGIWKPLLTGCIAETKSIDTGKMKRFIPPATEAPNAKNVGYIAVIILVLFLVIVLLMDLSTFSRDFQVMRANLKNIKICYQLHKKSKQN